MRVDLVSIERVLVPYEDILPEIPEEVGEEDAKKLFRVLEIRKAMLERYWEIKVLVGGVKRHKAEADKWQARLVQDEQLKASIPYMEDENEKKHAKERLLPSYAKMEMEGLIEQAEAKAGHSLAVIEQHLMECRAFRNSLQES